MAANIRFADVFDVAVIAVLLYGGLLWFRQRASRSIVVGLVLVAGLSLCASLLDMYLTTRLFQAGFTAVLLALIVVFQQDLRRALERLAAAGIFGHPRPAERPREVIDTLVEAIATMADQRTGAILVFEGSEPLDRHIRGGVAVDGCVSLPLLYSIFHPQSPGHDGAVLIERDRIARLGVHLPLSKNVDEIGHHGTRHAAALGLAEHCDALVMVVSEERGTISMAQHGQLKEIEPAELTAWLERYYENLTEPNKRRAWHHAATHNVRLKFAAFSIACILWWLFAYRVETIQRTFVVPIEYRNLAENWVIDEPHPARAELTISGSERAFDMLDASKLAVSFDLNHLQPERPYTLRTDQNLKGVPADLSIEQIRPGEVTLVVRRRPPAQR